MGEAKGYTPGIGGSEVGPAVVDDLEDDLEVTGVVVVPRVVVPRVVPRVPELVSLPEGVEARGVGAPGVAGVPGVVDDRVEGFVEEEDPEDAVDVVEAPEVHPATRRTMRTDGHKDSCMEVHEKVGKS